MTKTIKCPNGHGEMTVALLKKTQKFRGKEINYQLESYVCDVCGIEVGTVEQTAATQNAIADTYRKMEGLLSGEEIRAKRTENGWSQKDLARKAGVGIASVKRWENGIIQTRSMNQALKSAFRGDTVGNRYTGNRGSISIQRIKLVLCELERIIGVNLLIPGDKLLFAAKYLWYVDMLAFRENGKSVTGATYAALPYGPQLNNYEALITLIQGADENEAQPLTVEEHRIVSRVAATFPNPRLVYNATHNENVWKKRNTGDLIPYTAAEELTEI